MILKSQYPICEFYTSKNPIIQPTNFLTKSLPEKCVITFFRKELDQFVTENNLLLLVILIQKYLIYRFMSTYMMQIDFVLRWHFVVHPVRLYQLKNYMLWDAKSS